MKSCTLGSSCEIHIWISSFAHFGCEILAMHVDNESIFLWYHQLGCYYGRLQCIMSVITLLDCGNSLASTPVK